MMTDGNLKTTGLILILCVLVLLLVGSVWVFEALHTNRIFPGVSVWGIHVGGLVPSEAAAMLEADSRLDAPLLSLLGPILSVVYEGWVGYIAPLVGGVVGAATASGYVGGGIGIVGVGALVGAFALAVFEVSMGGKCVRIKDVGESLTAGLGFGFINGLILALLFWVLEVLR